MFNVLRKKETSHGGDLRNKDLTLDLSGCKPDDCRYRLLRSPNVLLFCFAFSLSQLSLVSFCDWARDFKLSLLSICQMNRREPGLQSHESPAVIDKISLTMLPVWGIFLIQNIHQFSPISIILALFNHRLSAISKDFYSEIVVNIPKKKTWQHSLKKLFFLQRNRWNLVSRLPNPPPILRRWQIPRISTAFRTVAAAPQEPRTTTKCSSPRRKTAHHHRPSGERNISSRGFSYPGRRGTPTERHPRLAPQQGKVLMNSVTPVSVG